MRTPEGTDSETGAPVASEGGGFDPDAPEVKPALWRVLVVAVIGIVARWCQ